MLWLHGKFLMSKCLSLRMLVRSPKAMRGLRWQTLPKLQFLQTGASKQFCKEAKSMFQRVQQVDAFPLELLKRCCGAGRGKNSILPISQSSRVRWLRRHWSNRIVTTSTILCLLALVMELGFGKQSCWRATCTVCVFTVTGNGWQWPMWRLGKAYPMNGASTAVTLKTLVSWLWTRLRLPFLWLSKLSAANGAHWCINACCCFGVMAWKLAAVPLCHVQCRKYLQVLDNGIKHKALIVNCDRVIF